MGKISLRRIAKEYDLPIKFLKDLHKTGRLIKKIWICTSRKSVAWIIVVKISGINSDKEGNLLIFIERRKSWLLR